MPPALDLELRGLRLARRLSLGTAAAMAGVGKGSLSAWENGAVRPRGPALARLLDALEAEPRLRARLLHAADPAFARIELVHSTLGAPVDVGMALRAMRSRRGMTQADLARRVGVAQATVSQWESGESRPSTETVHAVGFVLKATVEEALALASAQGDAGPSGLPDDPGEALARLGSGGPPAALFEVVSLGQEAELWRRAARDARWDECLVQVLAGRANWLVGQERLDEIAAPARRALALARKTEGRRQATPAVAALADADRHLGRGHAAAAEMAGAWAERLPQDEYRHWMLHQRGMCLARMGRGDEGAALIGLSHDLEEDRGNLPPEPLRWSARTSALCEARLEAGEGAKAAALIGGRRVRDFSVHTYVGVEHAVGRAATDADMAFLRYAVRRHQDNPQGRRLLERQERRQARLTGGKPMPIAPGPTDDATRDRLWEAVMRENPG